LLRNRSLSAEKPQKREKNGYAKTILQSNHRGLCQKNLQSSIVATDFASIRELPNRLCIIQLIILHSAKGAAFITSLGQRPRIS
jgi:hypothetical protein